MRKRRPQPCILPSCAAILAVACGGADRGSGSANPDASPAFDAGAEGTVADAGSPATACIPGRSVACVGPGGCASNQVCNADGSGYGPCNCVGVDAGPVTTCVPGQSIVCGGPNGCISHQVCNDAGTAYGPCDCSDASAEDGDVASPPPGITSFALIVDGVVQPPMTCPAELWEFPHVGASGNEAGLGNHRMLLQNTGPIAFAYTAQPLWSPPYVPGIASGDPGQMVGVLTPGQTLDLTPILSAIASMNFGGDGTVALLGSAYPFLDPYSGASTFAYDEGQVPWPAGLMLTPSAAQMSVAQISVHTTCAKDGPLW